MRQRKTNKLSVDALLIENWDEVSEVIRTQDFENLFLSDLSQGSWEYMSIAKQLAKQLDLTLSFYGVNTHQYTQNISQSVDAEALGDKHYIDAINTANQIVESLKPNDLVMLTMPILGKLWREEQLFIYYFSQFCEQKQIKFILIYESPNINNSFGFWDVNFLYRTNKNSPFYFVPALYNGIVDALLLTDLDVNATIKLKNNYLFLKPDSRHLLMNKNLLGKEIKQLYWLSEAKQIAQSIPIVWDVFKHGAYELATNVLENAETHELSFADKYLLLMNKIGIQIASMQFDKLVKLSIPTESFVPASIRSFMLQAKGWGLAMMSFSEEAQHCFEAAKKIRINENAVNESFYDNIYAFSLFRQGKLDDALKIELSIEEKQLLADDFDYKLQYINCINTARLYKKIKNFDKAFEYYNKAFDTHLGNRSESDLVYQHICWAGLYEDAGNIELAYLHWVRAATYWVAVEYPEAVSKRAIAPILKQNYFAITCINTIEDCSDFFIQKIEELHQKLYKKAIRLSNNNIGFTINKPKIEDNRPIIYGNKFVSFYLSENTLPLQVENYHFEQLNKLLSAIIFAEHGIEHQSGTIIIENKNGYDMPNSQEDIGSIAAIYGIKKINWNTEEKEISKNYQEFFQKQTYIQLSNAVESIKGGICSFKRYNLSRLLNTEEIAIIAKIQQPITVYQFIEDYSLEYFRTKIMPLQQEKLISFQFIVA